MKGLDSEATSSKRAKVQNTRTSPDQTLGSYMFPSFLMFILLSFPFFSAVRVTYSIHFIFFGKTPENFNDSERVRTRVRCFKSRTCLHMMTVNHASPDPD